MGIKAKVIRWHPDGTIDTILDQYLDEWTATESEVLGSVEVKCDKIRQYGIFSRKEPFSSEGELFYSWHKRYSISPKVVECSNQLTTLRMMIEQAWKYQQAYDLSDLSHDEESPIEQLEQDLLTALFELRDLRYHQHNWNEDGFCNTCGWDGNA